MGVEVGVGQDQGEIGEGVEDQLHGVEMQDLAGDMRGEEDMGEEILEGVVGMGEVILEEVVGMEVDLEGVEEDGVREEIKEVIRGKEEVVLGRGKIRGLDGVKEGVGLEEEVVVGDKVAIRVVMLVVMEEVGVEVRWVAP